MNRIARRTLILLTVVLLPAPLAAIRAADRGPHSLHARAAKIEITEPGTTTRGNPLYAKALVLSNGETMDVEVLGLRVGPFVLITFPGEPTVQIGLNIEKKSPHPRTFVAGCTNGYIYYRAHRRAVAQSRLAAGRLRLPAGPQLAGDV